MADINEFYPGTDRHPVPESDAARSLDRRAFFPEIVGDNNVHFQIADWVTNSGNNTGRFSMDGDNLSLPDGTTFTPTGTGINQASADQRYARIMHTHPTSEITGFEDAVTNNTAVAANTAKVGITPDQASAITNNTDARHDEVTLEGTPDYITIAGQVITRNEIDLANDVTGTLPIANINATELNQRIVQQAATVGSVHRFADNAAFMANTVDWQVGDILIIGTTTYLFTGTQGTSTDLTDFTQVTVTGGGISQATADGRYAMLNHTHTVNQITDFANGVTTNTAVAANTAKVGITTAQTAAITANTAKTSFPGFGATATTAATGNHNHDNRYPRMDASDTLSQSERSNLLGNIGAFSGWAYGSRQTRDFTALNAHVYVLDNISANSTMTLPQGVVGAEIKVVNLSTFQSGNPTVRRSSNTWTIAPASAHRIMGLPADEVLILDNAFASFTLTYTDINTGWVITGVE